MRAEKVRACWVAWRVKVLFDGLVRGGCIGAAARGKRCKSEGLATGCSWDEVSLLEAGGVALV